MKTRHKIFWLSPGDVESDLRFAEHLDNGWTPMFYVPTEKSAMVIVWKQTDALDGLSLAVNAALIKEKKNDNKPAK